MKKSDFIRTLKQKIGDYLNLKVTEFIMKKHNHNGMEIKNYSEPIEKLTQFSMNIYIELGNAPGEFDLKLNPHYCEYDYSIFLIFPYKISDIGVFTIDSTKTVKEIKEFFADEIKNKFNVTLDKEFLLMREYMVDKPTKVKHIFY